MPNLPFCNGFCNRSCIAGESISNFAESEMVSVNDNNATFALGRPMATACESRNDRTRCLYLATPMSYLVAAMNEDMH